MSKAFTRESDDSAEDEVRPARPQLPPGTRNYITAGGAQRLQKQLAQALEKKQASADAKPNAATLAESDQRKLESRIRDLQQLLQSVVVTEPPANKEKICFGASVRVRRSNQEEEVYRIVGVEESDPEHGAISWISPLARALLSKRAGDKVRFRSPEGEDDLIIVAVDYPPE